MILKVSFTNYLVAPSTVQINYSLYVSSVLNFDTIHMLQNLMCAQGRIKLEAGCQQQYIVMKAGVGV